MNTRLELVWPNKDKFLLVPRDADGKPVWVDPTHPAASEVRLARFTDAIGDVNPSDPYADNLLFTGDSLDVLRILTEVPEYRRHYRGKVRLTYIDPPFNTGQTFEHYDDWMEHSTWLSFMRDRLLLIKELLSPDGSVWVHLDSFEVHRMRCLMDEVFGSRCFLNQVVWQRTQGKSAARRGMGTMTDTLLVYGRTEAAALSPVLMPLTEKHLAAKYRYRDHRGRYMLGDLSAPGARSGDSGQPWRGRKPPGRARHWAVPEVRGVTDGPAAELSTQERLDLLDEAGYVHLPPGDDSVPMFKRYLSETSGTAVGDLWGDIGRVANTSGERLGYDTQKPEALLERVITMATEPGDIVLDAFAGSGTTAAAAHKMGRRWVTADNLPATVDGFIKPRLQAVIAGNDSHGISTRTREDPVVSDLPIGTTARDFAEAVSVIKAAMDAGLITDTTDTKKVTTALRRLGRTTKTTDVLWPGGGGFRTVEVGPSMYETLGNGLVLLADWATNGAFSRAVAGQLGFEYQDAAPFCGVRGRMRLAVLDGAAGPEEVRDLVARLDDNQRLTVVAKVVLPGTEELLAKLSPGSRVRKAPRDLLTAPRRRRRAAASDTGSPS